MEHQRCNSNLCRGSSDGRLEMKSIQRKRDLTPIYYQFASSECVSWKVAQLVEEDAERDNDNSMQGVVQVPNSTMVSTQISDNRCQVYMSWHDDDPVSGIGFFIYDLSATLLGLKSISRTLSPLHAELEALAWAMEIGLQRGYFSVSFETNCLEILRSLKRRRSDQLLKRI